MFAHLVIQLSFVELVTYEEPTYQLNVLQEYRDEGERNGLGNKKVHELTETAFRLVYAQ